MNRATFESAAPPAGAGASEFRRGRGAMVSGMLAYGAGPLLFLTTNGLFVEPIMQATGLKATEVQFGAVVMLFSGLLGPFAGWLLRRIQARRALLIGYASLTLPAAALMLLPPSAITFYGIAAVAGAMGSLCFNVVWAKQISTWFDRYYGTALGTVTAGGSLLPLLVTPVAVYAIYSYGWRAGFGVLLGTIIVFGVLPVLFGAFQGPVTSPERPSSGLASVPAAPSTGQALRSAFSKIRIWAAVIAFGFACFGIGGFLSSIQPMLLLNGFSVPFASAMSMAFILGNASGLTLGGLLLDRFWPYIVPLVVCVLAALGGIGLAHSSPEWMSALVVVIVFAVGMATGADSIFIPYFVRELVDESIFPVVLGIAGIVTGVSTVSGTLAFASMRDTHGDYVLACYVGGAAFVVAGALILLIGHAANRSSGKAGRAVAASR